MLIKEIKIFTIVDRIRSNCRERERAEKPIFTKIKRKPVPTKHGKKVTWGTIWKTNSIKKFAYQTHHLVSMEFEAYQIGP